MAFPTTTILDDFNRVAENPLSDAGSWDTTASLNSATLVALQTNGTQMLSTAVSGTQASQGWQASSFTQPIEGYFTLATKGSSGTGQNNILMLTTSHGANANGYKIVFPNANTGTWLIIRLDTGAATTLTSGTGVAIAVNDVLGMSVASGVITMWQNGTAVHQFSDGTYTGSLFVGFQTNDPTALYDNFGGGTTISSGSIQQIALLSCFQM